MATDRVRFHRRKLSGAEFGGTRLIDAQRSGDQITLYFGAGPVPQIVGADPVPARIAGGTRVTAAASGPGAITLARDGDRRTLTATPVDPGLFAGRNVILGVRHGETAGAVASWAAYHARVHGATAALILDCGMPAARDRFAADLEAGLGEAGALRDLCVVTAPVPLGRADHPPATHLLNAPLAPGKARMGGVAPDPWTAPLGEGLIFEALRHRFLSLARAVANLDVSDLIAPLPPGETPLFDMAAGMAAGHLSLTGRDAYPWQMPGDRETTAGDHICVAFDSAARSRRWVARPAASGAGVWRQTRIAGDEPQTAAAGFWRCIGLRHPGATASGLAPRASLVEDAGLLALARAEHGADPARPPRVAPPRPARGAGHTTVVTCMKNEGPFVLEWLAHHQSLGIDRYLVYSNDCTDGTDRLLDLLADRGLIQHRRNPYRDTGLKPQHAAFRAAETEPLVRQADWLVTIDVDEFINIHSGDGRMADLYRAVGDANMISMTWRLFGNSDIARFQDRPVTEQFTDCAPLMSPKPHQAWGFKTLFRHQGLFRKLGVHRPKGLVPQLRDHIRWVNGSGAPMPQTAYRHGWRSTQRTIGYDLVTLNHYAVRSVESFLVKRDRGRVNHVDRDQGQIYWFRMNNNATRDLSIRRHAPAMRVALDRLMADPDIAAAHRASVDAHRQRITELRARAEYAALYQDLTGDRMRRLSRLHSHFGAAVFWSGPQVVPDEVADRDPGETFFFTVRPTGSGH